MGLEEKLRKGLPRRYRKYVKEFKQVKYVDYAVIADELLESYKNKMYPFLTSLLQTDIFPNYDMLFMVFDSGAFKINGNNVSSEDFINVIHYCGKTLVHYSMLLRERHNSYKLLDELLYFHAFIEGSNTVFSLDPNSLSEDLGDEMVI